MSVEMMDGTWRDHIKHVLKLDAEEIPLWERIAESVPTHHLKHVIRMMIRREKEEMDSLRMLLDEYKREPGYAPGPGPGYGPGYDPGYGPGFDPMPYSKKDKEER